MQMLYRLAGIRTTVADHAVAICKAKLLRDFGNHGKDMGNGLCVFLTDTVHGWNMCARNDQNMHRGLRINVMKAKNAIVLIDTF